MKTPILTKLSFGFKVKVTAGFRVINSPHKDTDIVPPGHLRSDCGILFLVPACDNMALCRNWTSSQARE